MDAFTKYLHRWDLVPDGEPILTPSSDLLPVRQGGRAAMLKVARAEEERIGALLMEAWQGQGAATVMARAEEAVLLERASGTQDLAQMARRGEDDRALRILCRTISWLHGQRVGEGPWVPLDRWFRSLELRKIDGGLFGLAWNAWESLQANPERPVVLHGDVHHDNVLDFGERGWLAIDPKGLRGDRGYDYANLFFNPVDSGSLPMERFEDRLATVSHASGLAPERLRGWVIAYGGLSASWTLDGGEDPSPTLDLIRKALSYE